MHAKQLNKNRGFSAKNPKRKKTNGRGFFLALASRQAAAALMPNQNRRGDGMEREDGFLR